MNDKLHFRVNAELKNVIGRDLINNDNIAIIELVKNAYDAGSPHVNITLDKIIDYPQSRGVIVIEDNGCGMTINDINDKWLNIAYSEKKTDALKHGRRAAGNKGVGRFSCDRLGSVLDMYTRSSKGELLHVHINWVDFESASQNTEIGSISVEVFHITSDEYHDKTGFKFPEHGTTLVISELNSGWPSEKILSLKRELEKFANPHQDADLNTFTIRLICPEFKVSDKEQKEHFKLNGVIRSSIYEDMVSRTSSIESTISKDGNEIQTILYHRGNPLFTLVEKNPYKGYLHNIHLTVMYLNQYDKSIFTKKMGYRVIDFGTVFLFLHGFRIHPYGEKDNDWLAMDVRKAQKVGGYLGTRDVFGRIEINDEDDTRWRVISNREGLVSNESFQMLKNTKNGFFYRIFRKLERYVIEGLSWDSISITDKELDAKISSSITYNDIELPYKKTEYQKEIDVLVSLKSIITAGGTKPEDLISINFNTPLAAMLLAQKDNEISNFFSEFEALAQRSRDPKGFQENLHKLKHSLNKEKEIADRLKKERDKARRDASTLYHEAKMANERASKAERRANSAEYQVKKKIEENLFLKAASNQDIDDVVNMHHQVIAWSEAINKDCNRISRLLSANELKINKSRINDAISRIISQNRRILQLASFATKKNLKVNSEIRKADIINFIKNYLNHIDELKAFKGIKIKWMVSENESFFIKFKPLEITILIDNIIRNSKKAHATEITIKIISSKNKIIQILFDDDGSGLSPKIMNRDDVFNRGFTTTNGSGIGLNHALSTIQEMGGQLEVHNSELGGFALLLTLQIR